MAAIPIIGKGRKDATERGDETLTVSTSRIVAEFPNGITVDGAKIDVHNVNPEQIAVVIMHLQRVAMMSLAQRDAMVQQAQAEAQAVAAGLAAERN